MENEVRQMTLCDLDSSFGKMYPEHSPPQMEKISKQFLKKPQELQTAPYLYLDLREGYGNLLGAFWEINSPLLGEFLMLNTGVSPSDAKESFLSQILEETPLPKYYLSKTACLGILRRAKSRGKVLPKQLKTALEIQAGIADLKRELSADMETEYKSYHINQRNEGIDLNGISGALMATQNMQMQTFITEPMLRLNDQGGNNVPLISKPIVEESYCIASNIINRQDKNGGNGCGFQENISYTLTTSDIHAVCSPSKTYQNIVGALCVGDEKGIGSQYVSQDKCIVDCQRMKKGSLKNDGEELPLLGKSREEQISSEKVSSVIKLVRRLTPLECERLQGFPDGWTNIPKATDSPRYKGLGNSVAVPCVDFIMRGIAYFLCKIKREEEES